MKEITIIFSLFLFISCVPSKKESKENKTGITYEISVLRKAGFFEQYFDKTNKELIDILHKNRIEEYSKIFKRHYDPGMDLMKIELASLDENKMIFIDLEYDVCMENKVYCEVIDMYDKIGKEEFNPINVTEHWESETGPIEVSFLLNNSTIVIKPEYQDDWLHESVFLECEKLIEKNGKVRLVYCLDEDGLGHGQSIAIMRLSQKEQRILEQEFNWKFAEK